jgi:hypothetical protein
VHSGTIPQIIKKYEQWLMEQPQLLACLNGDEQMAKRLLLAWSGESFMLSAAPISVRPIAVGLAVRQEIIP